MPRPALPGRWRKRWRLPPGSPRSGMYRCGCIEELQRLLAAGSDIDARDRRGQTALMRAARHGHCQMVEWLIQRGAALDHTAKYGLSALMLAVIHGHIEVVRKLTNAGAN